MKIYFKKSFLKDFQKLPDEIKEEVKEICFYIFPGIKSLREIKKYNIKRLKRIKSYYRIKIKDYRVGFKKSNDTVIFMRVLHRKDIYKHFP